MVVKKGANVAWLSDLGTGDISVAGGKGANLGEMFNAKFPVPQAFVVTTRAFHYFLTESGVEKEVKELLGRIDVDDTAGLESKAAEIRKMIEDAKVPEDLRAEIVEAYDHFNIDLEGLKNSPGALAIMRSAREPIFVSVRSSATAEDLGDASFAGQQSSFINVKGNVELIEHVKKVFASIFTARSIFYRKKKGFDDFVGIAAIVQKMIDSEKSGVIFSRDPVRGDENILIESVFGQGEGIVSGRIKPDMQIVTRDMEVIKDEVADKKIAIVRDASGITKTVRLTDEISKRKVLKTYEIKQLAEYAIKLEEHYKKAQDIEFAIEDEKIYILQTRPITTLGKKHEMKEMEGQVLTEGLAASPGIASGVVKIVKSMEDLDKIKQGDVLVTEMTNPDMVVTMQKAAAIVTNEGGVTAHAAIVSREMGIPAVVGTDNATSVLEDGQEVTVDGFHGKVFTGIAKDRKVEILPIVGGTKTKIKVLLDLPDYAERAAKTKADGIGLVRLEGIIASNGKHPLAYEKNGKLDDYTKVLRKGLGEISELFIGKEIWIRTSDIRSDEYANLEGAPKEIEKNPMLGDHGIRFSLKHPEIFKAELRAIKLLIEKGHKFGVMFPQIISPEEVRDAKKVLEELGMIGNANLKVGVMIETPASTILIKDICNEGIDFISFGTNDLTQYTLAIDRGNEEVQNIYDETNWAVLKQISRVIRECKSRDPPVETSICGQAGSKKEMVEFLVKQGIDSISVNADVAKEISEFVLGLEGGVVDKKEKEINAPKGVPPAQMASADADKVGKNTIEAIGDSESVKEEVEERVEDFEGHKDDVLEVDSEEVDEKSDVIVEEGDGEGDTAGSEGKKEVFDVFS
jgi:pyruvate, water dikinase